MMTCEQFTFWVAGLLSAMDKDPDTILSMIRESVKNVVNPELQKTTVFFAE